MYTELKQMSNFGTLGDNFTKFYKTIFLNVLSCRMYERVCETKKSFVRTHLFLL